MSLLRVSCLADEVKKGAQRRHRKKAEKIYPAQNNGSANIYMTRILMTDRAVHKIKWNSPNAGMSLARPAFPNFER